MPQQTINVKLKGNAKDTVGAASVQQALLHAQAAVEGRGRAFLRPSGTEPVVRVTVEADDATLMQSTLDALADAVRAAARGVADQAPAGKPRRHALKRLNSGACNGW